MPARPRGGRQGADSRPRATHSLLRLPQSVRGSAPRLAQGSRLTTNEKGNGPARPAGGRYWLPTCGARRPALAPRGRALSPSPPPPGFGPRLPCGPRPPPDAFVYAPHGVRGAGLRELTLSRGTADSRGQGRGGRGASIAAGSLGERRRGMGGVREGLGPRPENHKLNNLWGRVHTFHRPTGWGGGRGITQKNNAHLDRTLLPAPSPGLTPGPPSNSFTRIPWSSCFPSSLGRP